MTPKPVSELQSGTINATSKMGGICVLNKFRILILISLICLVILSGCAKGLNSKKAISNEEIYPNGEIKVAKIFDELNNEHEVELTANDVEYIVEIIKDSDKELVASYDSAVELNISLTDSTIQLIREDDATVYYVFHNRNINGVCYKVASKELSEWILNIIEDSNTFPKSHEDVENFIGESFKNYIKISDDKGILTTDENNIISSSMIFFNEKKISIIPLLANEFSVHSIISPNHLVLETDGHNRNNSRQSFPELYDLIIDADLNCEVIKSDYWHSLSDIVEIKNGKKGDLSNILITFDGIQFQFSPSKDDEVNFYAAYTDVPATKVISNNDKEITIRIGNSRTDLILDLLESSLTNNEWIEGVEWNQDGDALVVHVKFAKTNIEYNISKSSPDIERPYVSIVFKYK